ncbi:hypothetical protein ACC839_38650, partial [Rhizobium ruizarguesonis]
VMAAADVSPHISPIAQSMTGFPWTERSLQKSNHVRLRFEGDDIARILGQVPGIDTVVRTYIDCSLATTA